MSFARLVMGLPVNLHTVTLQVMDLSCQECKDSQHEFPELARSRSKYAESNKHADALVKELKHGIPTFAKIMILL